MVLTSSSAFEIYVDAEQRRPVCEHPWLSSFVSDEACDLFLLVVETNVKGETEISDVLKKLIDSEMSTSTVSSSTDGELPASDDELPPPPPVAQPNFVALDAALNASMEHCQHQCNQQQLAVNEIKLLRNIPALDVHQQLQILIQGQRRIERKLGRMERRIMLQLIARDRNSFARLENSKVHKGVHDLEPMYCVNENLGEAVRVNAIIPGFPATGAAVGQLSREACRLILYALGQLEPGRASLKALRKQVSKYIGVTSVY